MRDGWQRVRLGDVAFVEIETVAVNENSTFNFAGVYNAGKGVFDRGVLRASDTNYPYMHILRPGRIVMRKLTAFEGPIAVVPERFDGYVVSPEFPTFQLNTSRILPEYAALICQQPGFWKEMEGRATGSVQRRKRVSPRQLLSIEIDLPNIITQRRIADLVNTIEKCRLAAARAADAARQTLVSLRENLVSGHPLELRSLIDDIEAGKSFQAERRTPTPEEFGVLKVSAIQKGRFDPHESKAVPQGVSLDPRWEVKEGDVLISRANTPDRVGMVCRVGKVRDGLFLCDKTLRMKVKEDVDPDYLVFAMQTHRVRAQIQAAATGTSSSMVNVSQQKLFNLAVPNVERTRQTEIASLLLAQRDAEAGYTKEMENLSRLRASILIDLLACHREIPDSYDALLS